MKYAKIGQFNKKSLGHPPSFSCLNMNDVISAGVSDHHPLIHDGVFFWNIMMKCNIRGNGSGFNNGFGIVESNNEYLTRLARIAQIIAEAIYRDPSIKIITICEGPIKPEHRKVFYQSLVKFPFMARFRMKGKFHKPNVPGQNWGLLMLADSRYAVAKISFDSIVVHSKLVNRFQLWKLISAKETKYVALAHFPFAGDEYKTEKATLSIAGQAYCTIINAIMEHYSNDSLILCADFNFNPYLISQCQDRKLDKISPNNSILLTRLGLNNNYTIKPVTVDGILLSRKEKQEFHSLRPEQKLLEKLKYEYRFFQSSIKSVFPDLLKEHNKQSMLFPHP